eukprot:CAMPEP_0170561304 /NCGR_PEP_ID=MMETSP0211-20121228/53989_1 /TAXON_ID=311385 /ORGANISM="Pseudokeronopsis sp., Strain OXSARD2" /LENGTH=47 /DNA_ID= /DNA_START= /DNA_END= /DNA_ORIENTATION=
MTAYTKKDMREGLEVLTNFVKLYVYICSDSTYEGSQALYDLGEDAYK